MENGTGRFLAHSERRAPRLPVNESARPVPLPLRRAQRQIVCQCSRPNASIRMCPTRALNDDDLLRTGTLFPGRLPGTMAKLEVLSFGFRGLRTYSGFIAGLRSGLARNAVYAETAGRVKIVHWFLFSCDD